MSIKMLKEVYRSPLKRLLFKLKRQSFLTQEIELPLMDQS